MSKRRASTALLDGWQYDARFAEYVNEGYGASHGGCLMVDTDGCSMDEPDKGEGKIECNETILDMV